MGVVLLFTDKGFYKLYRAAPILCCRFLGLVAVNHSLCDLFAACKYYFVFVFHNLFCGKVGTQTRNLADKPRLYPVELLPRPFFWSYSGFCFNLCEGAKDFRDNPG